MTIKQLRKLAHGIPGDARIIFDTGTERHSEFVAALQYDSESGWVMVIKPKLEVQKSLTNSKD